MVKPFMVKNIVCAGLSGTGYENWYVLRDRIEKMRPREGDENISSFCFKSVSCYRENETP